MKIESFILLISAFLIYNTYHDGKYTDMIMGGKKYFKMASYAFIGLSLYMFIKKHPNHSKNLLIQANDLIKYMPIDKNTTDLLTPIIDFTSTREKINNMTNRSLYGMDNNMYGGKEIHHYNHPQMKRMINSGFSGKRCVSETKKKFVAARQNWRCSDCHEQLDATFEVDHILDLQFGGSNHVDNLGAKCRGCHAKKGMLNKL
tara:strand:+ start:1490 stop:2095 length:606 start_codon:yes stop_codon:yes gene_type:complete